MKSSRLRFERCLQAFSLIELLTVMAVIVLLMVLTVPAFNGLARAYNLSAASQMVVDTFNLARQTASTQNRWVEARFYKLPDDTDPANKVYRAMQLFLVQQTNLQPLTRVTYFPGSVVIKDDAGAKSTILAHQSGTDKPSLPGYGMNYEYASLRIHPSGYTDLNQTNSWVATLIVSKDAVIANGLPANYAAARIDPASGKVMLFRP